MKQQNGLVLIEVLIASLILFLSLAVVATVFQQSFMTQAQADRYLLQLSDYNSLVAEIRFNLEQQQLKGDISTPVGTYHWQASVLEQGKELSSISVETLESVGSDGVLVLYDVQVTLKEHIIFNVKQAVWHPNAV